jgi:hypothetical protein
MTTFDWLAIIIGLAHALHHIVSHFNIVQFSMYTYHVRRMGKLTLLQLHIVGGLFHNGTKFSGHSELAAPTSAPSTGCLL